MDPALLVDLKDTLFDWLNYSHEQRGTDREWFLLLERATDRIANLVSVMYELEIEKELLGGECDDELS